MALDKIVAVYDLETKEAEKEQNQIIKNWVKIEKVSEKSIDSTNKNLKEQVGIVENLRNRIKKLEDARDKANDPKALKGYNEQLKRNKALLQRLTGEQGKQLKQTNKLTGAFGKLGGAIAAAFSIRAIVQFTKKSLELFDIQQKAEAQLLTALKGRENVQKSLIRQAAQLQGRTIFGDEDIIQSQALIAAFTEEEEVIRELTRVTLDFATAKGFKLPAAAELVSKTFASSTNSLTRYGIQVKGAAGSTERLISIVNALDDAFKGQAETAATVGIGSLQQLQNQVNDLREDIAQNMIPTVTVFTRGLKELLELIEELTKPREAGVRERALDDIDALRRRFKTEEEFLKEITKVRAETASRFDKQQIEAAKAQKALNEGVQGEEKRAAKATLRRNELVLRDLEIFIEEYDRAKESITEAISSTNNKEIETLEERKKRLEEERKLREKIVNEAIQAQIRFQQFLDIGSKTTQERIDSDIQAQQRYLDFIETARKIEEENNKKREESAKDTAEAIIKSRQAAISSLSLLATSVSLLLEEAADDSSRFANLIKIISEIEILANTAVAISEAVKNSQKTTGEPISGLILGASISAAIAGAAAATIATFKSKEIPSFDTGVSEFEGGLAKVHKDELMLLPQGTNIATKKASNKYGDIIQSMNDGTFDSLLYERYIKPERKSFAENMVKSLELQGVLADEKLIRSHKNTNQLLMSIDSKIGYRRKRR